MDNLTRCVMEAEKAGMSYGKYMALKQGKTREIKAAPRNDGKEFVCAHCGKKFLKEDHRKRKYCCDRCRNEAENKRRRDLADKKELKKTCPQCGKEFTTTEWRQKYCGEFCAKLAHLDRVKRNQARKKLAAKGG